MERFAQDVRFGVRMLLRHRGFTAAALLTLALGIGSNVVVFSLAQTMYFKRLRVPEADRLVSAFGVIAGGNQNLPLSMVDFRYIRDHARTVWGECPPSGDGVADVSGEASSGAAALAGAVSADPGSCCSSDVGKRTVMLVPF